MRYPVNKIGISQGYTSTHKGVDFGWSEGNHNQLIYAVDDGIVIYNRYQSSGGYVIHIRHSNGLVSEYGHLLCDSQLVKEGDKVKKGQPIARMGASGKVSGEHLHFGLYKGNKINYSKKGYFIDPLKYLCVYNNQLVLPKTKERYNLYHTKIVYHVPDEPLLIRDKSNHVVGGLYNGEECEYFGTYLIVKAIVDNYAKYTTYKKYLKG